MTLINKINETRKRMYKMGQTLGLSHPDTVKVSQQLDRLMNEHSRGIKA